MRRHLSFANVVSLIALFVALGGTSYAALTISGKNVKNRSLTGKDIKRNSLGPKEIKEGKLGIVPRAQKAMHADRAETASKAHRADQASRATTAGRADSAADADTVGGLAPSAFVSADRFFRGFVTARREQTTTVLSYGPYTILLRCLSSFGGGEYRERAQLVVRVAETARASSPNPEAASGGPSLPAGSEASLGTTQAAGPSESSFATAGGYLDVSGGRSLDVSARLRVNHLGTEGCSAIVNATFGGF